MKEKELKKWHFGSLSDSLQLVDVLRKILSHTFKGIFVDSPNFRRLILFDEDVVEVFVLGQVGLDAVAKGAADVEADVVVTSSDV